MMHGFVGLVRVSRFLHGDGGYFELVEEWARKRGKLTVQLADLPVLEAAFLSRNSWPDAVDPRITVYDAVPEVRLSNACESVTNLVYSMAEVAAQFANRATQGARSLPSSFNELAKQIAMGKAPASLLKSIHDLQWYAKVREIRTEWAHYSTPFVAESDKGALLIVRGYRRHSDKSHVAPNSQVLVGDLVLWCQAASDTLDRFAEWILINVVGPRVQLDRRIHALVPTVSGFPELTEQGGLRTREMTFRDLFNELGISLADPGSFPMESL